MAIKKLQQNYTTPEQSKRLLDLGLPADSADCYLQNESQDPLAYVNYTTHIIQPFHDKRIMFSQLEDFLPCWSVGRLIEIYNTCIDGDKDEIKIPKGHFVLQRVLIEFFAALEYGWLDFTKLEE